MTLQEWLEGSLVRHGAISGTVHLVRDDDLVLAAHVRIPPPVIAKVQHVPYGKGMAGVAQLRREPVQTCNLQTDTSGTIKPVAKLVAANAAIAVPVLRDGAVVAVVGFAFAHEGEIPASAVQAMHDDSATAPIPAASAPRVEQLLGDWRIAYGIAPDGRLYDGTARISADGPVVTVVWTIGGTERASVGLWTGEAAIVGDGAGAYVDVGDGMLAGRAVAGDADVLSARVTPRRHGVALAGDGWAGVGLRRGGLLGVGRGRPGEAVAAMWVEPTAGGVSARWVEAGTDGLGRVVLER
jgi:L-methionine (R)-S-oxide reductase